MRKVILAINAILFVLLFGSGCKEHFTAATEVSIWNHDSIPLDIYVNGTKAVSFKEFWGEVHLLSGDYEIVAKSGDKEVDKVNISLPAESEETDNYRYVFMVGKKKNHVLLNMTGLYDNDDLEIEEKYLNTNYVAIEKNTYRIYWPWSTLPAVLHTTNKSDHSVYQLFELPAGYESKTDEEIMAYCSELVK